MEMGAMFQIQESIKAISNQENFMGKALLFMQIIENIQETGKMDLLTGEVSSSGLMGTPMRDNT